MRACIFERFFMVFRCKTVTCKLNTAAIAIPNEILFTFWETDQPSGYASTAQTSKCIFQRRNIFNDATFQKNHAHPVHSPTKEGQKLDGILKKFIVRNDKLNLCLCRGKDMESFTDFNEIAAISKHSLPQRQRMYHVKIGPTAMISNNNCVLSKWNLITRKCHLHSMTFLYTDQRPSSRQQYYPLYAAYTAK
jgi:hypothetical protein